MVKLDRYDIQILKILAADGRITKSRLAEKINLSLSPAWERVRRLEASGLIRGYRADIDWLAALGVHRIVVEFVLRRHTASDMARFESCVANAEEVTQCFSTGGGIDYVVHVIVRDIEHYQNFIDKLLSDNLEIEQYYTYVVTKTIKEFPLAFPLPGC